MRFLFSAYALQGLDKKDQGIEQSKRGSSHLCILSGENTNTTEDFFFGGVFLSLEVFERLPPGESSTESGEGECVIIKFAQT